MQSETLELENTMTYKMNPLMRKAERVRKLLAGLALGCALAAHSQDMTSPTTPALITPPPGNSVFMAGHAVGTQGYVCLPVTTAAAAVSWTVKNARPEATLFQRLFGQDFQVITHFLSFNTSPNESAPDPLPFGSATWQSSFDSSKVWAQVLHSNSILAGSDPSCPNTGAIPCLLLQSIGSADGPGGGTMLSKTTFVQRLNTSGGSAPADGCSTAVDVGSQVLVPYTADYYFFHQDK